MNERNQYIVQSKVSSDATVDFNYVLEGGHNFSIEIRAADKTVVNGHAFVEISINVYFNNTLNYTANLYQSSSSTSEKSSSGAYVGKTFNLRPIGNTTLKINGTFVEGDEWSVTIYQDVPSTIDEKIRAQGLNVAIVMVLTVIVAFTYCCTVSGSSRKPDESRSDRPGEDLIKPI